MNESAPPLWLSLPIALALGIVAGTVLASFVVSLAFREMVETFPDLLRVWTTPEYLRIAYGDAFRIAYGVFGASVLASVGAILAMSLHKPSTAYGSAHWQSRREMRRNRMLGTPGTGFVCGKLGRPKSKSPYVVSDGSDRQPHVMMVAPTRTGKGVGFVVPNLLVFKGSAVVLDVKGENFERTARQRMAMGDEIFRFSPFDWQHATHRYNPLQRIANLPTFAQQFTEIEILADLFLDRENHGTQTFVEEGKSIFVAAALLAIQRGAPTLGAVNSIVRAGKKKNDQYAEHAREADEPMLKQLWANAASASDKLLTSNIQALMTAGLKQWNNPAVRTATDACDWDFATFRRKRQSLYITISEDHIVTLAPLLRLFFSDLIASLRAASPGPENPYPVMMMIDEFQQMGAMPYLERAIHTIAGYGGRIAMIVQSVASLDLIYRAEGRQSLENGAGIKLYIAPRDNRTVSEVSRAVGMATREAETRTYGRSRGFGPQSRSFRHEERPLLNETEARVFDPDDVIIIPSSQHPIRARRVKWYEDKLFAGLGRMDERPLPYPPQRDLAAERALLDAKRPSAPKDQGGEGPSEDDDGIEEVASDDSLGLSSRDEATGGHRAGIDGHDAGGGQWKPSLRCRVVLEEAAPFVPPPALPDEAPAQDYWKVMFDQATWDGGSQSGGGSDMPPPTAAE